MTYEKSYEEKKKGAKSIRRDVDIAEKERIASKKAKRAPSSKDTRLNQMILKSLLL